MFGMEKEINEIRAAFRAGAAVQNETLAVLQSIQQQQAQTVLILSQLLERADNGKQQQRNSVLFGHNFSGDHANGA